MKSVFTLKKYIFSCTLSHLWASLGFKILPPYCISAGFLPEDSDNVGEEENVENNNDNHWHSQDPAALPAPTTSQVKGTGPKVKGKGPKVKGKGTKVMGTWPKLKETGPKVKCTGPKV